VDDEVRCPYCGTAIQAGKSVCPHCEQPVLGAAVSSVSAGVRRNPVGAALPSPIQGHATVLVGVVVALIVLAFFAFNGLQGVGPFKALVVSEQPLSGGGITVRLNVTNDGTRAGNARCKVTGRSSDGELVASDLVPTGSIAPKASAQVDVPVGNATRSGQLDVACS
jgi:hypothetical protein